MRRWISCEPMTHVLQLTAADVPQVRALNALFGAAFDDRATYGGHSPDDAYVAGLLAKEHVIVLVALDGEPVVGGLVGTREEVLHFDIDVPKRQR